MNVRKVALFSIAALLLGCGGPGGGRYTHQVTGGSVNVSDNVARTGRGSDHSRQTHLVVTPPATAPAATASIGPPPTSGAPVKVTIGGQAIEAPAGSGLQLSITENGVETPDSYKHDRQATGYGATLKTDSANGTAGFTSALPDVQLPKTPGESGGAGTDGGETTVNWASYLPATSKGALMFFVLAGIAAVAAGVYCFFTRDIPRTLIIAGVSVALVTTAVLVDKYPSVFLLLFAAAAGGAVLWFYLHRKDTALTAVVAGIEAADPVAAEVVKGSIARAGGAAAGVKSTIAAVKEKLP